MNNQPHLTVRADTTTRIPLQPSTSVFDALAHSRRRVILSKLEEGQRPISERDLATQIAACEQEKPLVDVTNEEQQEIQISLYHWHLPKLEDLGMIERDLDDRTVVAKTSLDLESTGLLDMEDSHNRARSGTVDTLFGVLANNRRRIILSVLKNRRESHSNQSSFLTVEELAEAVAEREHERSTSECTDEDITRIVLSLQHCHLPKLADMGLIVYDRDQAIVTYEGPPTLRDDWVDLDGPLTSPR